MINRLDQLRSRLNSAGFSDLNFLIVNSAAAASETLGLKTMRSMAGEIPVYQEPTNGSIWGNVLEGGVDHILIMDRCVRLAYQVIMPWSILNYPYVKAAILSTYNEDPCGPCIHPTISVPSNTTISSNKTELSFPENTTTEIPNQIAPAPTDNITISGTYYSLIYGATTPTTPGNISANLKFEKASASNRTKNHAEYSEELSTTETDPTGGEQGTLLPVLSLEDGTVPIKEQRKQKWRGQHLRTTTTTEKPTTPSQPFYEEKNIEEVFETKSNNAYLYRIENDQQTSTTEESQHSHREHKEDDDTKQEAEQKAMYDDQSNYAPSYENYQPILTEEENKHSHREHKEDDETRQEDEPKAMYDDQSNYAPSYENYQPVSTEVEEKHSQREHKAGENTRQEGGGKHHHKNKLMVEEGLGQSETQPKNVTSVDKSEAERNMLGKEQQNRGEKDKVLVKERDKVQDQKNEQIVQENQNEEDLDSTRNTIINHYSKLLLWLDYPL
uniref:Selenoprotein P N-terminal domain-containing protein n=1 Tax=Timema cristinae TaxID=61476 RepID=A0A7R9CI57_TIMCR|nr:unnamed protein product [Timema cristinae]